MLFDKTGAFNTPDVVSIVRKAITELDPAAIVVASSSGNTALQFINPEGVPVVCVGHAYGRGGQPGKNRMTPEARAEMDVAGIPVIMAAHIFSGAEEAVSARFGGLYPAQIMGETLRIFGEGVKVCVEIAAMALDAGAIPWNKPVIAVSGSGHGADSAVLITPSYTHSIFDTRIHTILCKPSLLLCGEPHEDEQ